MPTSNIAVSVILPVLHSRQNLVRCIESVLSQTLKDIEVILSGNISSEGLQDIIYEYGRKDSRIKILSNSNISYGAACNLGIDASNGKYIGFVDTGDWIESNMYEELYRQANKHHTDVVKSLYYYHAGNETTINTDIYHSIKLFDTKINDKFSVPNFYLTGPSIWSAIYNKNFIIKNSIRFNEHSDSTASHLGFAFLVFSYMSSLFIRRVAFYHYILDDDQLISNDYQNALKILNEHDYISNEINKRKIDKACVNLEVARSFKTIFKLFNTSCITISQRVEFLNSASKFLIYYLNSLNENVYLSNREKSQLIRIAKHPRRTAFLSKKNIYIKMLLFLIDIKANKTVKRIKVFSFPIIFIKNTGDYKTINICNIPIKRVKRDTNAYGVKTKYYYFWMPLAKRVDTNEEIKKYFLGIRTHKEINIQAQLSAISKHMNNTLSAKEILHYSNIANTIARVHSKTFPQFKNSNVGQTIAVFGTGPTLNFAPNILNTKTICCNRAFEFLQTKGKVPDYIFVQDYPAVRVFLPEILKKESKIFIGRFPNKWINTISTPEYLRNQDNIYSYYAVSRPFFIEIRPEIECNLLFDHGTVVHPALHFALYTNPEIIYLIGCDTSATGYFNKNIVQGKMNVDDLVTGYKEFKGFSSWHYPNTRIISINPVGLRGLFEDQYTKSYLEQNDEIDSQNITIVDSI